LIVGDVEVCSAEPGKVACEDHEVVLEHARVSIITALIRAEGGSFLDGAKLAVWLSNDKISLIRGGAPALVIEVVTKDARVRVGDIGALDYNFSNVR
jgi:hypothetical protein